mmetsp:Transcript_9319/g.26575  ORF Transcript_9319/g.26575 Transcript_9319/m.26575 type:complete len:350 (-) Transcript_9319:112-1161(-)
MAMSEESSFESSVEAPCVASRGPVLLGSKPIAFERACFAQKERAVGGGETVDPFVTPPRVLKRGLLPQELAEEPSVVVCVRNTFIEVEPRVFEEDSDLKPRAVFSCPASRTGKLDSLFDDQPGRVLCDSPERERWELPQSPSPWRSGEVCDAAAVMPASLFTGPAPATSPPPPPSGSPPMLGMAAFVSPVHGPPPPPPFSPCAVAAEWSDDGIGAVGAAVFAPAACCAAMGAEEAADAALWMPPCAGAEHAAAELPSIGSSGHAAGTCKPCAFLHTKGCDNGSECQFCHLCDAQEKKRRHKEKIMLRKATNRARQALEVAIGKVETPAFRSDSGSRCEAGGGGGCFVAG